MTFSLKLSQYTLAISPINNNQLFIKIKSHFTNTYYQTIIKHDSTSGQFFNNFDGFEDVIEHLKVAEHLSVNFQQCQIIIYGTGRVGKNRKYFELLRLPLERVPGLHLQTIIEACEKQSQLTAKQVKQYICCLATNLEKAIKQNERISNNFKSLQGVHSVDIKENLENLCRRTSQIEQKTKKFTETKNQYEVMYAEIEQILKQVNQEFSIQIKKIVDDIKTFEQKLSEEEKIIKNSCVQYKRVQDTNGVFSGMVINDKRIIGEYNFFNGDKYIGNFQNDKFHGKGVYHFEDGSRYEGQWVNEKECGVGEITWKNGDRYFGHWSNGNFEGLGEYFFAKGDKMKGKWHKDLKQGIFIYEYENGIRQQRLYLEGELIQQNQI